MQIEEKKQIEKNQYHSPIDSETGRGAVKKQERGLVRLTMFYGLVVMVGRLIASGNGLLFCNDREIDI